VPTALRPVDSIPAKRVDFLSVVVVSFDRYLVAGRTYAKYLACVSVASDVPRARVVHLRFVVCFHGYYIGRRAGDLESKKRNPDIN
jgi:hypothetical protein